jgi:hypothetical protein
VLNNYAGAVKKRQKQQELSINSIAPPFASCPNNAPKDGKYPGKPNRHNNKFIVSAHNTASGSGPVIFHM